MLGRPESGNGGLKENPEYHQMAHLHVRLRAPLLQPGQATSPAAQGAGVVGILLGPPEMLQKAVLKKKSPILESWRTQVYYASEPRGINTPSSETQTEGLQGSQWHPTPVLLPEKSHGWRSLVGCSPWDR